MVKSYARSAVRSLLRDRVPALINVVGLSIALASSVVVYLFLQVYYTLDTFHERGDRVFMVEHVERRDGADETWGTAPLPLGPLLAAELPQVERAVRVAWAGADVRTAEAAFEERVGFADPGFFEVFTVPLAAGSPDVLAQPGSVILSHDAAQRYFGSADPLGRRLTVALGDSTALPVTVAAVAAPFPNNTGLRFEVLMPFGDRPGAAAEGWGDDVDATFLLVRRPDDVDAVAAAMGPYLRRANEARALETGRVPVERFVFENLVAPAPGAYRVLQRPTEAPHPAFALMMVGLALFMTALSCFNYVNIALGSAHRRLKEIGVRKVLGGSRRQLVAQFMTENLLLCLLALGLGLAIAAAFLVPLFNRTFVLQIGWDGAGGVGLWAFLVGLLASVAVLSGAYPALYVARFQPTLIFQGKAQLARTRGLTGALTTAQFVLAFLAVISTVVLLMNGRHLSTLDWGYRREGVVVVRLLDAGQAGPLRDAAEAQAGVVGTALSQHHRAVAMPRPAYTLPPHAAGPAPHDALALTVGPGYLETMGVPLVGGRFFSADLPTDATASLVVNRRFVQRQGWTNGVGETVTIDRRDYTVVGVVDDFLSSPIEQPGPVLLRLSTAAPQFLAVRVRPGREAAVQAALEAVWRRQAPDLPLESFTQAEVFDRQIAAVENLARGVGYLAALALLIACMGVFGLASQNVARRMKEVSVRKVLGATVPQLVLLVNRPFLVILGVAAVLASGVVGAGLAALAGWDEVNLMPLTPLPFAIAYVLVLVPVTVSVAAQSRALARADPAAVLRGA